MKKYCLELQQKYAEIDYSFLALKEYVAKGLDEYRIDRAMDMKKQISGALEYLLEFMSWWKQARKDALLLADIASTFHEYKGTKSILGNINKRFYRKYISIDSENRKIIIESTVHKDDQLFSFHLVPLLFRHHIPQGLVIKGQAIIKAEEMGHNLEEYLKYIPDDFRVEGDVLILGSSRIIEDFFADLKDAGQITGAVLVDRN